MYTGTTPTIILTFPEGTDFSGANVYVSLANDRKKELIRFENPSIEDNVISISLTQEQTIALPRYVLIQVNWVYGTQRACSNIVQIDTKLNVVNEVLT